MFVNSLQFLFQQCNSVTDDTTVSLNLRFSRTSHPNTSFLTLKVGPGADEAGALVGERRELDLLKSLDGLAGAPQGQLQQTFDALGFDADRFDVQDVDPEKD